MLKDVFILFPALQDRILNLIKQNDVAKICFKIKKVAEEKRVKCMEAIVNCADLSDPRSVEIIINIYGSSKLAPETLEQVHSLFNQVSLARSLEFSPQERNIFLDRITMSIRTLPQFSNPGMYEPISASGGGNR